jgi:hypothetical protein
MFLRLFLQGENIASALRLAQMSLWRLAIECTVWGDLFNRPVCGLVRSGIQSG